MSKWTAMAVLGTTFGVGLGAGWLLKDRPADGPALAAPASPAGAVPPPRAEAPVPASVLSSRPPSVPTPVVKAVPTPGHFFRLGASDTFSEIAKRAYGTTKRVADLQRANPTLEAKNLKAGTLVYVPAGREPVPSAPATTEPVKASAKAGPIPAPSR